MRKHYLLTGFSRCEVCGGSMQAVSRASSAGRIFRYCCATYWNRGASVCANGRMASMLAADDAVAQLLKREVLQPRRVERAIDRALALLQGETSSRRAASTRATLDRQLATVDRELANLAETAAPGGAAPVILEALARREDERRHLRAQLAALAEPVSTVAISGPALKAQLRGFLDGWESVISKNVAEARLLLDLVLVDRIAFRPPNPENDRDVYTLIVPIAFDRLLTAAVPDLRKLQCEIPGQG